MRVVNFFLLGVLAHFASAAVYADSLAVAAEPRKPQKIASLNLCLDALLIKLVERDRIDSLTYLSADPQYSPLAAQTKGIYLNNGLAEDLVPRNPDLILAGDFGAPEAVTLLQQLGFRVERLPLPRTIADIPVHIRRFGKLVGGEVAAEKMVSHIEQQLALLDEQRRQHGKTLNAFWYSSNGVVVAGDTLENEIMQRAGFHNLALDKNLSGFAQMDLEDLILARPQVIIVESADTEAFSLAGEYLQHPVLRKNNTRVLQLPATLSLCSAPVVADVLGELAKNMQQ
ncbi:MAG TPA: ABC transporter substrate-binding protein [Cellvibrio sp.]|nr:ABC transporter substrate-binding protein [Cellvibrio sp.]